MRRAGGRGRRVVVGEGRLNVIKEGGVTQSLASPFALIPDTENIGRVSFLGRGGYYTCEGGWVRGRGTGDGEGGGGGGSERLGCFQDILLRFLRLAPAVGLSKDEFEFSTYSTPLPSSLLPPFFPPHFLTSFLSSAKQSTTHHLRCPPSRATLENFPCTRGFS